MSPTDYPRTHDLSLLLRLLEDEGEDIEVFWSLLELNPFAIQFRYELAGETFPNFESLTRRTEQLLAHVRSLLAGSCDDYLSGVHPRSSAVPLHFSVASHHKRG